MHFGFQDKWKEYTEELGLYKLKKSWEIKQF